MSKLIEELREYVTNGFGVFTLDQQESAELLAHIERLEQQLKQCRELMGCNDPGNARAIFGDAG